MTLLQLYKSECVRVSKQYLVPLEQILKSSKLRRPSAARAMVAKAMRFHSPNSLAAIGRLMGVNHTTVIRMLAKDTEKVRLILLEYLNTEELILAKNLEEDWNHQIADQMVSAEQELLLRSLRISNPDRRLDDPYRRRFEVALLVARKASEDQKDATFKGLIKSIFPFTTHTPSALVRRQEAI